MLFIISIYREKEQGRSRSLNKTTTRCARRTTSGQGCNDDRHPVGPGGLLAVVVAAVPLVGLNWPAKRAMPVAFLLTVFIAPLGLADEPDPGLRLHPAGGW